MRGGEEWKGGDVSQGCLELNPVGNSRKLMPRTYPPPALGVRELGIIHHLLGIMGSGLPGLGR